MHHQESYGNGLANMDASGRSSSSLVGGVKNRAVRVRLPNHQVKNRSGENLVVQQLPLHRTTKILSKVVKRAAGAHARPRQGAPLSALLSKRSNLGGSHARGYSLLLGTANDTLLLEGEVGAYIQSQMPLIT